MPIKFRCQYCRQFLGISRSKAGDVVDCPTCGRAVRVPNLDGSVAPVPEPKLNVHELAGALDELAKIGDENADDPESGASPREFSPAHKPVMVKELAPLPRPEPISLEPPPVAVPVDIYEKKARPAPEKPAPAESLGVLVPESGPAGASVWKSPAVIGSLAATAVVMFAAGWWVGGLGNGTVEQADPPDDSGKPVAKQSPAQILHPIYLPDSWKTAVKGQITWRTSDGKNRPDAGARIIILPESRKGGLSKLPVGGFRVGANEADFRVAQAGLRELGGNAALADQDGNFTIKLPPSSGNYHVVAISAFKDSDLDTPPPASQTLFAEYFDQPDGLIRKLAYKHGRLRYDGSKVEPWNHSFE